jgi:hypothetical protein
MFISTADERWLEATWYERIIFLPIIVVVEFPLAALVMAFIAYCAVEAYEQKQRDDDSAS